jgi:hypothetical protein
MLRKRSALLPGRANEVVRDAALDGLVGKRTALRALSRWRRGGALTQNRDSFSESRRTLGDFGETMPGGKALAELLTIERSAKQMSLERKVLSNRAEAR